MTASFCSAAGPSADRLRAVRCRLLNPRRSCRPVDVRFVRVAGQWVGFEPQLTGREGRVDSSLVPPRRFIAMTMQLAVMATAERHGELVADLAAERPALGKAQVMGVGRFTAADQTSLLRHKAHMVAIADAPRLGMRENRFVDRLAAGFSFWFRRVGFRNRLDRLGWRRSFRTMLRRR